MRRKIIAILCCMLMIASMMTTIINTNNVKGEEDPPESAVSNPLDITYIWNWTQRLANVIYDAYNDTDIPRGRSFGSKGGDFTKELLKDELEYFDLDDVHPEQVNYIDDSKNNYSSIINVTDFQLEFNSHCPNIEYPYENPIPKKEMFAIMTHNGSGDISKWTNNFSFTDADIIPNDMTKIFPLGGTFNENHHLHVTNYEFLNNYTSLFAGNVSYLASEDPVPTPDIQYGTVYIVDDVSGSQEKLDNLTNAMAVIIIDLGNPGIQYVDASECTFPVVSMDSSSGDDVKELLNDGMVIIDNAANYGTYLTFTYNLEEGLWPDSSHLFIDRIPNHFELWNYIKHPLQHFLFFVKVLLGKIANFFGDLGFELFKELAPMDVYPNIGAYFSCVESKSVTWWKLNKKFPNKPCVGIILYDSNDYHFMVSAPMGASYLPIFTINNSAGEFLKTYHNIMTVSGYSNQTYIMETANHCGTIGYNVMGNLTNDNPNAPTVVISNRYDGMWGQTPGDSGVGTAIVLGIAKYFKYLYDIGVKPKYNLTFLFTTGEEYGFRGAKHFNDSHNYNIKYWFILDQLAFDQSDAALCFYTKKGNNDNYKIIKAMADDSHYRKRTNYSILPKKGEAFGSEQWIASSRDNCDSFCLVKDQDFRWDMWHRTGSNYTKGDCLDHIDRNDTNITAELFWNVTKYYLINPNCWFSGSITYSAVDSPYDTDSYDDSINATFSVKTILPCDKVRVKAKLNTWPSNTTVLWKNFDFYATSTGVTKTITVTLPPSTTNLPAGNYQLMLELYNSTGRIDEIVYLIGGGRENDSDLQSNYVYLYPRGNIVPNKPVDITGPHTLQVFQTGTFNTSTTDSNNDHVQYQWYWEPFDYEKIGPYASGDTCSIKHKFHGPGLKTIYVRAREDYYGYLFDGPLSLILKRYGDWGEWSNQFNVNVKLLTDFNMACTKITSSQNAQSSIKLPSVIQINSLYHALIFGGTEPNTYEWNFSGDTSQEKNVEYNFSGTGTKTVTLNVTDNDGYSNEISVNVTVVNLSASYNLSIPSLYADPEETILFNDTSSISSRYHITNWTWDFDDGTICYDRNATHLFDAPGVYNVTLSVTDNESGTDVYNMLITVDYDFCPPEIIYVGGSPDTVGFGMNVSIAVDATDDISGVDSVHINVTNPNNASTNYTMTHVINDTYFFVFNDTWQPGVYNYSIWVVDQANNTNCTSGFNFTVSAEATINIATLQDSYSGDEYINITDPPNPPVNLTVVGRGLTWNTYYNATSGNNILEAYQTPVNYQDDNGTWTPINSSLQSLAMSHPAYTYGYRKGNDRGLFGVYFKPNVQNDWPIAFTYNRSDNPTMHVIRSKLVGVGYVDPASNWSYQYLQNVQSSQGQTTRNSITYEDVFTGTDVTWRYSNTGLKEEITLSNATKTLLQNHPPSQYGLHNASSYLVFITRLDNQSLNLYNASGVLSGNVTISKGGVAFKDALGRFTCALPLGEAYELNNESAREKLMYRIVRLNGNTYLLSGLKVSDLNAMTFPVIIDPTLTVYTSTSDGHLSASDSDYNTTWSAKEGTVSDTDAYIAIGQTTPTAEPENYTIYRGFLFFNTSSLPSNAIIDNATITLYKKDDYSTTDFIIRVQNGQPTYPHDPLETGDYDKENYGENYDGHVDTADFRNETNEIKINLTNMNWINGSGVTKLCLRSNRDINGTAPTGDEYITVYSAEEETQNFVPSLIIMYRNQSKIKNTGSTGIKGYLLIQVQYYDASHQIWVVDNDTINETSPRTINNNSQLALDIIFNGLIRASDLIHGTGTYRVYTAFRDPDGNILKTDDETELEAWWQFSKI